MTEFTPLKNIKDHVGMEYGGVGVQGACATIKSRKESNELNFGGDGSVVSEAVGADDDALHF